MAPASAARGLRDEEPRCASPGVWRRMGLNTQQGPGRVVQLHRAWTARRIQHQEGDAILHGVLDYLLTGRIHHAHVADRPGHTAARPAALRSPCASEVGPRLSVARPSRALEAPGSADRAPFVVRRTK